MQVVLAFFAIYSIWGSTYLAIRFAIETLPPFLMAAVRFLSAGAVLYGWTRFRGATRPTLANWRAATIVGALLLLVYNGGVVNAEQVIPSGLTAVLVTTVPIWIAFVEVLQRERVVPSKQTILGIALGFGGVAFLVGPVSIVGSSDANASWAGVVVLVSLAWAFGSVYSRKASLPKDPLRATGMEMLAGGVLLLLASLISNEWTGFKPGNVSILSLVSLLYLIVPGSLIAFSSYMWLLTKTTTTKASTHTYVNPVVAVFIGFLLGSEPITARTLVALSIIVCAVVVINTYKKTARDS